MNSIKSRQNLFPELTSLGTYESPRGGSRDPAYVGRGEVLFEVIREGTVYGFEEKPILHGQGAVFCHCGPQHTVSESPPESYYHCYVLRFTAKRSWFSPAEWPRVFLWEDSAAMEVFLEEMLRAFHAGAMDRRRISALLAARLAFELERSRLRFRSESVPAQLALARDFIHGNYDQDISLHDVARVAAVSVPHLHMLFRRHLGETPHQCLIQKRMRVAGHALATGGKSIKEVAADVGYASTENFCRAFRKFFGRSASEYRRACRR